MPNLTASTADGYTSVSPTQSSTTKADTRNSTSGTSFNNSINFVYAIHSAIFSRYYLFRPLFFFDFSGNDDDGTSLSGQTVSAAAFEFTTTANITGFVNWFAETDKKVIVCKTDGVGSSIDTGDFNRLDNWPSSGTYEGTVTKYGEVNQAANASLSITLSAQAITDINAAISGSTIFSMAMLTEDDWTFSGDLFSSTSQLEGIRILSANSTTKPKLNLTYGGASSAPVYNAALFGTNF
tara:strand:+ start:1382 stop:2095 length:714 start_codon:yes stop_codon:yes gene_type:complete